MNTSSLQNNEALRAAGNGSGTDEFSLSNLRFQVKPVDACSTEVRECSVETIVAIEDRRGATLGSLEIRGLTDEQLAGALEHITPCDPDGSAHCSPFVPAETLSRFVEELHERGASLTSSLGEDPFDIVYAYSKHIENLPESRKPHMRALRYCDGEACKDPYTDILSPNGYHRGALRWVDIQGPTKETVRDIIDVLQLSDGTRKFVEAPNRPISATHQRRTLVVAVVEAVSDPENPGAVRRGDLIALCGDGFLVTLHTHASPVLNQVFQEMKDAETPISKEECSNSNYLFSRVLGCLLHRTRDTLEILARESDKICKVKGVSASSAVLERIDRLAETIRDVKAQILPLGEVIDALCEERNLYGLAPKEQHQRYRGLMKTISAEAEQIEKSIEDQRSSWSLEAQNMSNKVQYRLGVLAGAVLVPATVFSFLGQSFTESPFTNRQIFTFDVCAFAFAGLLISGLRLGPFRIFGSRREKPADQQNGTDGANGTNGQ